LEVLRVATRTATRTADLRAEISTHDLPNTKITKICCLFKATAKVYRLNPSSKHHIMEVYKGLVGKVLNIVDFNLIARNVFVGQFIGAV
jgi:hypothetical protein